MTRPVSPALFRGAAIRKGSIYVMPDFRRMADEARQFGQEANASHLKQRVDRLEAQVSPLFGTEAVIEGTTAAMLVGQHISVALIGALLRELVQRETMTLEDAQALIARVRTTFDSYEDDIQNEQLGEAVRSTITNMFDRVSENLLVP